MEQKHQKILIISLAALVVGAGGIFGFTALREPKKNTSSRPYVYRDIGRAEREEPVKKKSVRNKRKKRATAEKSEVTRKTRKKKVATTSKRRSKKRGKQARLKKQEAKPMG